MLAKTYSVRNGYIIMQLKMQDV